MGAKTNSRQGLAEVDIVLDVSRGAKRGQGTIASEMVGSDDDDAVHSLRVSSSDSADSSDAKPRDMNMDVSDYQDKDEVMVDVQGVGEDRSSNEEEAARHDISNGHAIKNTVASKLGGEQVLDAEAMKDSGGFSSDCVVLNGSPHGTDRAAKNGGTRKRKSKTIHYMNSKVPHAVPILDSEEGSDGQDSPEEGDDVLVRPSQAPRAAATKVGSRALYFVFFNCCCRCLVWFRFVWFVCLFVCLC